MPDGSKLVIVSGTGRSSVGGNDCDWVTSDSLPVKQNILESCNLNTVIIDQTDRHSETGSDVFRYILVIVAIHTLS